MPAPSDVLAARPAVIVDLGNVVALFEHARACRQLAALSRVRHDAASVAAAIFASGLEAEYDCGRISTEAFVRTVREVLDIEASDDDIGKAWSDIFTPNPALIPTLGRLRDSGVRLVLGSNTNALHYRQIEGQFANELAFFGAFVLSFRVGARKPDARFFAACLRECAGRTPVFFLDDRADFVAAAAALGIRAHQYVGGRASALEADVVGSAP